MKIEIIPSLIAKNQKELNKIYNKIKVASVIQLDIMDEKFVKNKSLWFNLELPKHKYEAHLMIQNPRDFITNNIDFADIFIVQIESCKNQGELIDLIKFVHKNKKKFYLGLNPRTPVSKIKNYLGKIDGVLVMTVMPGKYGAKFMPEMLKKVSEIRQLKPKLDIEVDGSMNPNTIKLARLNGANKFSVGSFVHDSKYAKDALKKLKMALQ